ncbi:uncharacterized protein FIBRA_05673 [Fibroporia radiculosa]|uniref:Uncharacterized protein n=1 Tax=Fibroporia radiculosa TaxID=599839 RepID=J4H3N2_9APHY|nr:uncharacterized protein FIBRA_05673 [Fibroporia radiculosa]CCM03539.1 predicted protein [Fibroporia radiculosa]
MSNPAAPSMAAHTTLPQRPRVKRLYHTWPSKTVPRSHFEDFLREIGESSQLHQLCCLPRQACTADHHVHEHLTSTSTSASAGLPEPGGLPPLQRQGGQARHSRRGTTLSIASVRSSRSRCLSLLTPPILGSSWPSHTLKTDPVSAIDLESHPASGSYFTVDDVEQSLRGLLIHGKQRSSSPPRPDDLNVHPQPRVLLRFAFNRSLLGGTGDP